MKPTLSVRIEKDLYTAVCKDLNKNAYIVTEALSRYYMAQDTQNSYTNEYNHDLVSTLQLQIQDLKSDKNYLQQQNNALMLSSIPLLSRIKIKLLSPKSQK